METAPKNAGTSLEVLAPYLPYGVCVMTPKGLPALLCSLYKSPRPPHAIKATVYPAVGEFTLDEIMPVLLPFSALTTPLADGTVPAVEVAKLLGRPPLVGEFELRCEPNTRGEAIVVYINGGFRGHLVEQWETCGKWAILKVADYLRRNHFAVGLEPHQYIAKEPAAASTPTREGAAPAPSPTPQAS